VAKANTPARQRTSEAREPVICLCVTVHRAGDVVANRTEPRGAAAQQHTARDAGVAEPRAQPPGVLKPNLLEPMLNAKTV